jgi:hypothetical protein
MRIPWTPMRKSIDFSVFTRLLLYEDHSYFVTFKAGTKVEIQQSKPKSNNSVGLIVWDGVCDFSHHQISFLEPRAL